MYWTRPVLKALNRRSSLIWCVLLAYTRASVRALHTNLPSSCAGQREHQDGAHVCGAAEPKRRGGEAPH
jgi:hypothetical protein